MKRIYLLALGIWASVAFSQESLNLNKDGFMLNGNDPVSYFKSEKPVPGNSAFQVKQGLATFRFANEENKAAFLKEPAKYQPQFGGWCAYAIAGGSSKVDVDPDSFLIQDGRLLLFYKGIWGDTRDKWQHTKDKDPKTFLKDADAQWVHLKNEK